MWCVSYENTSEKSLSFMWNMWGKKLIFPFIHAECLNRIMCFRPSFCVSEQYAKQNSAFSFNWRTHTENWVPTYKACNRHCKSCTHRNTLKCSHMPVDDLHEPPSDHAKITFQFSYFPSLHSLRLSLKADSQFSLPVHSPHSHLFFFPHYRHLQWRNKNEVRTHSASSSSSFFSLYLNFKGL